MRDPHPDRFDTPALQGYLDRWRAGDREAADDLLRGAGDRLTKLARKMCRGFPNVTGRTETADVLNAALFRLLKALRTLRPGNTRDFFNLAAVHLRRELIDLARHYRRRTWVPLDDGSGDSSAPAARPVPTAPPAAPTAEDFDLWARFHEAVDELPVEEREVVGLVFYHGWTQAKIAALFGVDERTVRRRWAAACSRLRGLIGGQVPGG
ncbi:MAG: sigma-70 family RNA polymerase sigma factor [Gemmataceae bacterium]|nr:sigma-70 family RNA polymerase sigma factor [Gemmataceae bacterium]